MYVYGKSKRSHVPVVEDLRIKQAANAAWEPGSRYGKLTVLEAIRSTPSGIEWEVRCDCGTVKWVRGTDLKRGVVKSCGKAGCKTGKRKMNHV